ncbi:uncharacterized protein BT62DRAFT_1012221 [Guyanagaster necrorhizus]|uniref:Uncharacterized protein n=1 Tax=Guyanagaster necrorhizus TaxID=856835 RepID=A0A9P7VIZ1_9AGAR|nr:uncharacterized protein BT62DRAFT_1012221 [Guyanagaster necrorhizus MCA 3950]KAG7440819.1 hypothetical protein BT62DRAFT_1012221 [Guyanagaster necrorhizus MCA 3950]
MTGSRDGMWSHSSTPLSGSPSRVHAGAHRDSRSSPRPSYSAAYTRPQSKKSAAAGTRCSLGLEFLTLKTRDIQVDENKFGFRHPAVLAPNTFAATLDRVILTPGYMKDGAYEPWSGDVSVSRISRKTVNKSSRDEAGSVEMRWQAVMGRSIQVGPSTRSEYPEFIHTAACGIKQSARRR